MYDFLKKENGGENILNFCITIIYLFPYVLTNWLFHFSRLAILFSCIRMTPRACTVHDLFARKARGPLETVLACAVLESNLVTTDASPHFNHAGPERDKKRSRFAIRVEVSYWHRRDRRYHGFCVLDSLRNKIFSMSDGIHYFSACDCVMKSGTIE